MAQWMVKLAGHEFDLRALTSLYNEPVCRVAKDDDSAYYLTRDAFEAMGEAAAVDNAARECIAVVNADMRLRKIDYEPVSLDGVYSLSDGGNHIRHIFLPRVVMSTSARLYGKLTVLGADGLPVPSPEPTRAIARLQLAERDAKVRIVLSCWRNCIVGDAGFWIYAYKVYEIIRAEIGAGDKKKGRQEVEMRSWASSAEINGFGEAANNPAVSGDTARHGAGWQTPSGVTPFTEGEALAFIQRLLNHWLDWKITPTP